jgi:HPt (histidine-containing phosphotransfer) domain-containing protein
MTISSETKQVWLYLDPLRAIDQIGDEYAMRSMLPMLQEMLERDVPQIEQLLAVEDVRGANPLLHSMKGCFPIFCAAALCDQLAGVEHMSKSGGSAEVAEAFALLHPKLQSLQREVAQYLAQAI